MRQTSPPAVFQRIAAFGLDYLVIAGYLIVLAVFGTLLVFSPLNDRFQAFVSTPLRMDLFAFVTAVLPVILYFTLSESSPGGATWGKRRMGLRVVDLNGEKLTLGRALARSLVKFLPWQIAHTALFNIPGWPVDPQTPPVWVTVVMSIALLAVGFYIVTLAVTPNKRAPYDWVAGSIVIPS